MSERDPLEQLAAFRIDVDDDMSARNLEAIRNELRRRPVEPVAVRRRWTLGVVVAMLLAGPVAAVASDAALPGDLLFPIKRAVEPIVLLFDPDAAVEHRVEEVAGLVDREADEALIRERIDVARDALAETDARQLERELDRIVERWGTDRSVVTDRPAATTVPRRDAPPTDEPGREPEPAPVDVPETTTTDRAATTEPPPPDRTTTSVHQDTDDRPPSDDRPRDTP